MSTPARLLAAAVAELRSVLPGDDVAVPGGAIPAPIAEALADWLEICHRYVSNGHPDLALASPFRRGGVGVAQAILGGKEPT